MKTVHGVCRECGRREYLPQGLLGGDVCLPCFQALVRLRSEAAMTCIHCHRYMGVGPKAFRGHCSTDCLNCCGSYCKHATLLIEKLEAEALAFQEYKAKHQAAKDRAEIEQLRGLTQPLLDGYNAATKERDEARAKVKELELWYRQAEQRANQSHAQSAERGEVIRALLKAWEDDGEIRFDLHEQARAVVADNT